MIYTLRVYGVPKGSPRPRASSVGGKFARMYMPDTDRDWKACVREAVERANPKPKMLDGPVEVSTTFFFPRPKAVKKAVVWHTKKPDRDNADKSVLDALVQAGALRDDKSVCCGTIKKLYCEENERPGALVWIRTGEDIE